MKKTMFLMLTLAAALAPAPAMTKWSGIYKNVTYVAVTENTHGIPSPYIGVLCTDGHGNRLRLDQLNWTVDDVTHEVDITFNDSFTGVVRLSGPWPTTDTGAGTDFAVTIGQSNNSKLNVCAQCGTFTALRTYNGNAYVASSGVSLTWVSFTAPAVYVYLRGNVATYGLAETTCDAGSYTLSGVANVECGVFNMPVGVVPLASATISGGEFTSVTDLRPW